MRKTFIEQNTFGSLDNQYKFNEGGALKKCPVDIFSERARRRAGKRTETGLYYYGARFYDPRVSFWYGVDPLVEQTGDAYGYCYQNPINLVDPDGRSAKEAAEPPLNGLEYFRDDTGEYFWNQNKNAYDHFQNKDGNGSVYQGIYRADTFKEPVGEYTIIFDLSNAKPKDEYNPEYTINSVAVPLMAALVKAGKVKDISNPDLYPGVKIYSSEYMNGALTAGNVIFTNPRMESVLDLGHEYGHYLDFKYHFKFNASEYIKKIAIPSFKSAMKASIPSSEHIHESSNSEKRANRLGGAWTGEIKLKNLFRK